MCMCLSALGVNIEQLPIDILEPILCVAMPDHAQDEKQGRVTNCVGCSVSHYLNLNLSKKSNLLYLALLC